jgi:cell division protein FtsB
MSWHDPARDYDSSEDRELREELSQLLGLPTHRFFEVEPTPKMIALAEDLRREALRRRHTSRRRPVWMLLAAGLPLALALTAMGTWGLQHKRRADALAAAIAQKESELQRLAKAAAEAQFKEAQAPTLTVGAPVLARNSAMPLRIKAHPGELVIEVKPSSSPMPTQTQTVKQRGQ